MYFIISKYRIKIIYNKFIIKFYKLGSFFNIFCNLLFQISVSKCVFKNVLCSNILVLIVKSFENKIISL